MQSSDQHLNSTPTSQVTTLAAQSPFGPQRKREKPPVRIPGQRKPSDVLPPRRPFPAPPIVRIPLSHDLVFNRAAYDEAYTAFQRHDRIGTPAAWAAFGDELPAGA
jgi:hypothetical protein